MATKTTKASTRGTKATTKKKKGLLSKVNLYSRRTQFILIVLLIAVAGGGYFTYKSFAATHSWTTMGADLSTARGNSGGCAHTTFVEQSKNNTTAVSLACPASYRPSDYNIAALATWGKKINRSSSPAVVYGGQYRACAMVRGAGKFKVSIYTEAKYDGQAYAGIGEHYTATGSYARYCSQYRAAPLGPGTSLEVQGSLSVDNPGTWIAVSSITVEREQTAAAAPAPAPAK